MLTRGVTCPHFLLDKGGTADLQWPLSPRSRCHDPRAVCHCSRPPRCRGSGLHARFLRLRLRLTSPTLVTVYPVLSPPPIPPLPTRSLRGMHHCYLATPAIRLARREWISGR